MNRSNEYNQLLLSVKQAIKQTDVTVKNSLYILRQINEELAGLREYRPLVFAIAGGESSPATAIGAGHVDPMDLLPSRPPPQTEPPP